MQLTSRSREQFAELVPPPTRYAQREGIHIAYQTFGDGPVDIVLLASPFWHVEMMWEEPLIARALERLAQLGRVIVFDRSGTGLSDPLDAGESPTLTIWQADLDAVRTAVGSRRVVVFAHGAAVPVALAYAAGRGEEVRALVLHSGFARLRASHDFPVGLADDVVDSNFGFYSERWGTGESLRHASRSLARDSERRSWFARFERQSASPGVARAAWRLYSDADARPVLADITTRSLILHHRHDELVPFAHAQYLVDHLPNAILAEVTGEPAAWWASEGGEWIDEVSEFLTGRREQDGTRRLVATILFTDIVGSTERAANIGDRAWSELRARHDEVVRSHLRRFDGRELETAGDEFMASFSSAAPAIRAACAIRDSVRDLGIQVRAGIHAGEIDRRGNSIHGLAVHVAHRVLERARPSQVLVSRTVTDLVIGDAIRFSSVGEFELKGVPGRWDLSVVEAC